MISTHYYPSANLPMISLTVNNGKLLALDWYNDKTAKLLDNLNQKSTFIAHDGLSFGDDNQKIALQTIKELDEYFQGKRQNFTIPLDISHGTPFQVQVWQALLTIPYGKTISYKELAEKIGKPTAFRACANANGKNFISLIVPCHRVIASDGALGGYTGGVEIKKALLDLEKITITKKLSP